MNGVFIEVLVVLAGAEVSVFLFDKEEGVGHKVRMEVHVVSGFFGEDR